MIFAVFYWYYMLFVGGSLLAYCLGVVMRRYEDHAYHIQQMIRAANYEFEQEAVGGYPARIVSTPAGYRVERL